jgi:hypothetical protein
MKSSKREQRARDVVDLLETQQRMKDVVVIGAGKISATVAGLLAPTATTKSPWQIACPKFLPLSPLGRADEVIE